MRILIPTVDYPPIEGGISTVALELSRALARQGHCVTVVAPWFPGMDAFDASEPATVIRFHGYDLGWLRLMPLFKTAWPLVRKHDLVLGINVSYGGLLGLLGRHFAARPYINFAYGYEFLKFARNPFARLMLHRIYGLSRRTIAISRFTREHLLRFGVREDQVAVVLPGAKLPEPVRAESIAAARHALDLDDAPYILAVGRFIPRKNHVTLVEALALLQEQGIHAHLVMAGRGPELSACVQKAAALGIEGSVHCPGYVDEETLHALYQDCACFALPTGEDDDGQVEGFGLVFTEAHACGKAVVAGRSGGVVDAVQHEKTGLLVPPRNPDRLAQALARLLTDPEYAASLGAAGRKRVETELNWDQFARRALEAAGFTEAPPVTPVVGKNAPPDTGA